MHITNIPFAKLKPGSDAVNARRHGREDGIDRLAARILAQGLLVPLIVRKNGSGYEVVAGNRRRMAIGKLVDAGKWTTDVPCEVRKLSDKEALAVSLAENAERLQMHPVDEYQR